MHYGSLTYIVLPHGNNALSYTARKNLGSSGILAVPSLVEGTLSDIQTGEHIVFEEVDEKGVLCSCVGLAHHIFIPEHKNIAGSVPIYIIDNHNHALYHRYHEHLSTRFGAGATLIHIDQHADMGTPDTAIDPDRCNDIDYIYEYTNNVCNVGNFIQPAVDSGLIGEVIQIRSVTKLLETTSQSIIPNPYILDIDIDFWVDHSPTKEEINAVRTLLQGASVCTIALSPYFMKIEKGIEVVRMLCSE